MGSDINVETQNVCMFDDPHCLGPPLALVPSRTVSQVGQQGHLRLSCSPSGHWDEPPNLEVSSCPSGPIRKRSVRTPPLSEVHRGMGRQGIEPHTRTHTTKKTETRHVTTYNPFIRYALSSNARTVCLDSLSAIPFEQRKHRSDRLPGSCAAAPRAAAARVKGSVRFERSSSNVFEVSTSWTPPPPRAGSSFLRDGSCVQACLRVFASSRLRFVRRGYFTPRGVCTRVLVRCCVSRATLRTDGCVRVFSCSSELWLTGASSGQWSEIAPCLRQSSCSRWSTASLGMDIHLPPSTPHLPPSIPIYTRLSTSIPTYPTIHASTVATCYATYDAIFQ